MGTLGGILLIVAITMVAGLIAYIGDRVGHQVGRKRLTMFGLRPRYTSTIVAVGTGMLIALVVTSTALLASNYARAAFFHLSDINNRVNELQSRADALDRRARLANVEVNRGTLAYDPFLLLDQTMSADERLRRLSAYFDAVVANVNRTWAPRGLKPFPGRSSDPETRDRLRTFLASEEVQGTLLQGPMLVIAAADENLFVNDPIHFGLQVWRDKLIFAKGASVASVQVDGGTTINPRVALTQLLEAAEDAALAAGLPNYYAQPTGFLSDAQVKEISREIRNGRGRFEIVARASQDVYPHTGGLPIELSLVRPRS